MSHDTGGALACKQITKYKYIQNSAKVTPSGGYSKPLGGVYVPCIYPHDGFELP